MKHRRSSLSLSIVLVGALVLSGSEAVKPSSARGRSCFPKPAGIHKRILSLNNYADVHLQLDVQARLSTFLSLRGGEVLDEEDGEVDDALVGSVRTVIKAVLGISGPILGAPVKLFIKILEGLLGVKLLPQPKLKRKVAKRSSSSSGLGSKKTSATATSKKRKKKKRKSSVEASDPKAPTKPASSEKRKPPAKKKKASSVSDAAMMHLKTKLSPTNPNYRIQRELRIFVEDPPDGLRVRVGKNLRVWIVDMKGVGIYKSEKFQLRVKFPSNYPTMPPSVYFLPPHIPTHEHVYTNGDICLSLLGKDWRPTMSAQSIVLSIQSILGSAQSKSLPMDNVKQAQNKPGEYQKDWVYHDDCELQCRRRFCIDLTRLFSAQYAETSPWNNFARLRRRSWSSLHFWICKFCFMGSR